MFCRKKKLAKISGEAYFNTSATVFQTFLWFQNFRHGIVIDINQSGFMVLLNDSFDIYEWDDETEMLVKTGLKQNEKMVFARALGVPADMFCP